MVMTIASKNEYHIIYDDGTQIAKFTASKIEDVWKNTTNGAMNCL
jgi:hypothetical protein